MMGYPDDDEKKRLMSTDEREDLDALLTLQEIGTCVLLGLTVIGLAAWWLL